MLVNISLEDYENFVKHEGKHKVLYAEMTKALYGNAIIVAALLKKN
jgi:hypothetical protein